MPPQLEQWMIGKSAKLWHACGVCLLMLAGAAGISAGGRPGTDIDDFLRLESNSDRDSFRQWFAAVAEYQALRPAKEIPAEISDCAALLRFSYKAALHLHSQPWLAENHLEPLAFLPSVRKYTYPHTPLGASLFRVRPAEEGAGARESFAQFADARTLMQLNAFFVSRDVRMALPGDLLFYRQLEQNTPYHSMVFVGRSRLFKGADGESILVYHTGPNGKTPGEMRRVTLNQLLQHPSPRWRPETGNSNFLGVYRWNILKDSD